jgi:AhpD family alkylhydroperoxidase
MFSMQKYARHAVAASALLMLSGVVAPALGQDVNASAEQTYAEIEGALGGVPDFIKMYPKAAVAGAWAVQRDLVFGKSSLDAKTKALISLAVAAQIPCMYCIYSDTMDAKAAGATDDEIHEAVAIAGQTRNWSTVFNGYMIDFETYKKELGYEK